jgi:hypothetical protein
MSLRAGASEILTLRIHQDGSLRVYESGFTLIFDSADPQYSLNGLDTHYLVPDVEYRIELRAVISATVGELEIRVNSLPWCRLTGINTGASNITRVYFHTGYDGSGAEFDVSEIYVFDGTGAFNKDFLGIWKAQLLRPTSDSAAAFTRLSGAANYEMVDDVVSDADATRNSSTGNAQTDRFATTGTLSGTIVRVQAVNVVNMARRDASSQNFRNKIRHSASDANGADVALVAEDYRPVIQSFETNPSTSAQWTKAEVEASSFGYESRA